MVRRMTLSWARAVSLNNCLVLVLVVTTLVVVLNFLQFQNISEDSSKRNIVEVFQKLSTDPRAEANYLAKYLDVRWTVKENLHTYAKHILVLKNTGKTAILNSDWKIYFHHIRILEPVKEMIDDRYQHNIKLGESGFMITHIFGMLFCIFPDKNNFKPLRPGEEQNIPITSSHFQLSKTDVYPNWYVLVPGSLPQIITSTAGENSKFVADFTRPQQWKRSEKDEHNPLTPEDRYNQAKTVTDLKRPGKLLIPTPEEVIDSSTQSMVITPAEWVIIAPGEFPLEAKYLSEKFGIRITTVGSTSKCIRLIKGKPQFSKDSDKDNHEAYELRIDASSNNIFITAPSGPGLFNGIQSLIHLAENEPNSQKLRVKSVTLKDRPRFHYRGLMLDLSRNFHKKTTLLKLIDVMAMYKLNKLHLHLSDDDGWRLEIPDIPELTELGSKRCHDVTETSCLMPSQGSGPYMGGLGTGYYTVDDYKEILRYADQRHIQVVPEIDMPSHMRAALMSIKKFQHDRPGRRGEIYKMTDKEDGNNYRSAQGYNDNSANPCREGLYNFIEVVLTTIVDLHKNIQPLTLFHFGGDEVPTRALQDMKCSVVEPDINKYFIERILNNKRFYNISFAAWEDGMLQEDKNPYKLSELSPNSKRNLYAFVWTEHNKALFRVANEGYKVINSRGAYLYFDHPYEPDPEERGLYWATRFIDTPTVFGFNPLKGKEGYGTLDKPHNIIGVQAQLWTELIRTEEQLEYMTFPRLLAFAERAWHMVDWLDSDDDAAQERDWVEFANTLSYKEFPKLDKLGVKYRLPPPGAVIKDGKLAVATDYPGLQVEYNSVDKQGWNIVRGGETITGPIVLRTTSPDGRRHSREVRLVP